MACGLLMVMVVTGPWASAMIFGVLMLSSRTVVGAVRPGIGTGRCAEYRLSNLRAPFLFRAV